MSTPLRTHLMPQIFIFSYCRFCRAAEAGLFWLTFPLQKQQPMTDGRKSRPTNPSSVRGHCHATASKCTQLPLKSQVLQKLGKSWAQLFPVDEMSLFCPWITWQAEARAFDWADLFLQPQWNFLYCREERRKHLKMLTKRIAVYSNQQPHVFCLM